MRNPPCLGVVNFNGLVTWYVEKRRSKEGCREIAAKEVTVTRAVSAQRSAACTKVVAVEWMKQNPDWYKPVTGSRSVGIENSKREKEICTFSFAFHRCLGLPNSLEKKFGSLS